MILRQSVERPFRERYPHRILIEVGDSREAHSVREMVYREASQADVAYSMTEAMQWLEDEAPAFDSSSGMWFWVKPTPMRMVQPIYFPTEKDIIWFKLRFEGELKFGGRAEEEIFDKSCRDHRIKEVAC